MLCIYVYHVHRTSKSNELSYINNSVNLSQIISCVHARDEEERHKKKVESIAAKVRRRKEINKLKAIEARQKKEMMVRSFHIIKYLEHVLSLPYI